MFSRSHGIRTKLRFRSLQSLADPTSASRHTSLQVVSQESQRLRITCHRQNGYGIQTIRANRPRTTDAGAGLSVTQQRPFQAISPSTSSAAKLEFGHESEDDIKRRQDRDSYIKQIAQHLPQEKKENHVPVLKQRRSEFVKWQPPSVKTYGHEGNPFQDWQTALMMLEKHYTPDLKDESHADVALVRQVNSTTSKKGLKSTVVPPGKPHEWTQRSLTAYIQSLVDFRPPRPILFEVLPSDAKRQYLKELSGVADTIESTLHDTELRGCANIDAANIALQFFYDKEMMDRARSLYLRMEYLYLDITTVTWNIILRASASIKDLHNFTFLLDKMIERGFKPNQETWAIFVMALSSVQAKQSTIKSMKTRGIMDDPSARRNVATQMVQAEFIEHFEQNLSSKTFFDKMQDQYGPDWLSTSTGNIIISEVIRSASGNPRLAVVQALRLLYEMKQQSFTANGLTMDLLLREAGRIRQQDVLIEILDIFEKHWGLRPDRQAHQRLFVHAWRKKALNLLRAIWVSACLNGFVSFIMQDLVMKSILSYKGELGLSEQPIPFKHLAGWFLLSVDPSRPLPGENNLHWKPGEEGRLAVQGVLAMKSNLATVGQGHLTHGLTACLRHAFNVDSHWFLQKFWNTRRKQMSLLNKQVHLSITRNLDHKPLLAWSNKRYRDRLARRRSRRLIRALDLRHKKDLGSLSGMKIRSITRLSSRERSELTFRLGRKGQLHTRHLSGQRTKRQFLYRRHPGSLASKIFYQSHRPISPEARKSRSRRRKILK